MISLLSTIPRTCFPLVCLPQFCGGTMEIIMKFNRLKPACVRDTFEIWMKKSLNRSLNHCKEKVWKRYLHVQKRDSVTCQCGWCFTCKSARLPGLGNTCRCPPVRACPCLPRVLEGAELIIWDGAEWVELRLEVEGLAWDEDKTETLVTELWHLGLG